MNRINLSSTLWAKVNNYTFALNRPNFVDITIVNLNLIRLNLVFIGQSTVNNFEGENIGYILAKNNQFIVNKQDLLIGNNIIVFPSQFQINQAKIFIFPRKSFNSSSQLKVEYYKPATQIIINPLTQQPVILGQESLNAIKDILNQA